MYLFHSLHMYTDLCKYFLAAICKYMLAFFFFLAKLSILMKVLFFLKRWCVYLCVGKKGLSEGARRLTQKWCTQGGRGRQVYHDVQGITLC